jgi:hypothetical protein
MNRMDRRSSEYCVKLRDSNVCRNILQRTHPSICSLLLRYGESSGSSLTPSEIAAKLNAEGQDTGWGGALVDAEASELPELYTFSGKWCLKNETSKLISTCEERDTW